jgi:glycosyltransferase involved in cell wall biosynthesis
LPYRTIPPSVPVDHPSAIPQFVEPMPRAPSILVCTGPPEYPLNQQNWRLSRALVDRGHRVTVVTDLQRHDLVGDSESGSVTTWPSYHPTGPRDLAFIGRLIGRERPDAILANFGAIYFAMIAARLQRIPIRIAWYRSLVGQRRLDRANGVALTEWIADRGKRIAFGLATHVVPVSSEARDELSCLYGVPEGKCTVIPTRRLDPTEEMGIRHVPSPAGGRVVCVARLVPSKGQDVLLRAFARLIEIDPEGPWALELVGEGPQRAAYEALAAELGIGERVEFTGYVEHREVFERAARADVMVVPFRTDAGPGVIAEGLGLGLPLIACDTGAMGELVGGSGAARLVPPEDTEAMARTLHEVLGDARLRASMSRQARELFLRQFHIDSWIRDVLELLDRESSRAGLPAVRAPALDPVGGVL